MGCLMDRDPAFLWALGISVVCHAVVIATQTVAGRPLVSKPMGRKPLEVIYEQPVADRRAQAQDTLADLNVRSAALPTLAVSSHRIQVGGGLNELLADHVPGMGEGQGEMAFGRPGAGAAALLNDPSPFHATVVDLSNLVEASRGDPVLLSYFSAVRERIQRTANQRTWMSADASEGIVSVAFVLTAQGQAVSPRALPERSVSSPLLQEIAVKIVAASGPFPPLPPSLQGAAKTIVVPLEFLRGS